MLNSIFIQSEGIALSLRDVPLDDLTARHLHEQIENGVPESRTVDYKRDLPGNSDSSRQEFLKDVCALANSSGGDLVYGMDEENGIPTELRGLEVDNTEQIVSRLENMIRDNIDPRVSGISTTPVPLEEGRYAVVVRVPRSFRRPHVVSFRSHWRFYYRHSTTSDAMDINEVRDAFVFSESLADRMRDFRTQRLADLKSGESPVSMEGAATAALHIMPLSAFDSPGQNLDLTPALNRHRIQPMQLGGQPYRNFDGVLTASRPARDDVPFPKSYALIFRTGVIEAADSEFLWPDYSERDRTDRIILVRLLEGSILEALEEYMNLLSALDIEGPVFIALSLLGVRGYVIPRNNITMTSAQPIDRDDLVIPEIMAESLPTSRDEIGQLVQPVYDSIWNACGFAGSPYYDEGGYWRG